MLSRLDSSALLALAGPLLLSLSLSPLVDASCGHGLSSVHPFLSQLARREGAEEPIEPPKFGYDIATGPLYWHTLTPENGLCATGTSQSPIIINSATNTLAPKGSVKLHVPTAHNVTFANLGTTVETVLDGTLEASGKSWTLAQFHFHTPSEHRVNLRNHEIEMHMVFEGPDASVAVLAYFIDVTPFESNHVLDNLMAYLPAIQEPQTSVVVPVVDFAPFQAEVEHFDYFTYSGSLTTPPCSEGVFWHIATTPLKLRAETYLKLKHVTKTNNRYSQADQGTSVLLTVANSTLALAGGHAIPVEAPKEAEGLPPPSESPEQVEHARRRNEQLYW